MRQLLKRVLSEPARSFLRNRIGGKAGALPHAQDVSLPYQERFPQRHDTRRFDLGEGVELAVYWKDLPIGRGPAISLHVGSSEPLKFDCFGRLEGHFHTETLAPDGSKDDRIWLPEESRRAQVERAIFEIEKNARYYMDRSCFPEARQAWLDPARMEIALPLALSVALGFLDSVPQLAETHGREDFA